MKKQLDKNEIMKECSKLKRKLTELQNSLVEIKKQNWINITKQVSFCPMFDKGSIYGLDLFYMNFCIGGIWFSEFPEIRQNKDNYKIEWFKGNIRILWKGDKY